MAIYAVKKGDETNEKLIARFKKSLQNSTMLKKVRECRFRRPRRTKRQIRLRALYGAKRRVLSKKQQFYSNM